MNVWAYLGHIIPLQQNNFLHKEKAERQIIFLLVNIFRYKYKYGAWLMNFIFVKILLILKMTTLLNKPIIDLNNTKSVSDDNNSTSSKSDSQTSSPGGSSCISKEERNTQSYEQELRRLAISLTIQKQRNEVIQKEVYQLAKQSQTQQCIINQMQKQKKKHEGQLQQLRSQIRLFQEQRNKFYIENGTLYREQGNIKKLLEVSEQKVEILEKENNKLIDDLNFEKEIASEYRQQINIYRNQLKNTKSIMEFFIQQINQNRKGILQQIKTAFYGRAQALQKQISFHKNELFSIKKQQKELIEQKVDMFNHFAQEIKKASLMKEQLLQLRVAQSNNQEKLATLNTETVIAAQLLQNQLRKTINDQRKQIHNLVAQISKFKIGDKEKSNQNQQINTLGIKMYSNSTYLKKVLQQNHLHIQNLRREVQEKKQEIEQLRELIDIERTKSNLRQEQISNLKRITKVQQSNLSIQLKKQIQDLNSEKMRLNRKIEQLNQNQAKLKNDIMEKDRIIMSYIATAKGQKVQQNKC